MIHAAGPRSTSPADGSVIFLSESSPLSSIWIECPWSNPSDGAAVKADGGNATLSKDGQVIQTLPPSQATRSTVMNHFYEVTYSLLDGVYEPGEYTFSVPANTITYGANDTDSNLDAFSISFTVLDANSMIVTPSNGSIASALDLSEIVLQYNGNVKLQIQSLDKLSMTQTQGPSKVDIATYSVSVKGQTITLTCDADVASVASKIKRGSGYGNLTIKIPANTWTVDGVGNIELTYEYVPSSFSNRNVTFNPAPRSEPYTIDQLRRIEVHFDTDMSTTDTDAAVKLEQKVDGIWNTPNGCSSTLKYRIEYTDKNNAVLTPKAVAGKYNETVDELESGEYRFVFVQQYTNSKYNNVTMSNAEIAVGPYYLKGATEAAIISQKPKADSAIRATDWENIILEFSSEMITGTGDILIKDAEGNIIRTLTDADVSFGSDAHSAEIVINPIIARSRTEEKVYTVEIPQGFLRQSGGAQLPSAAANFTITVGKYVKLEESAYPKFAVNPAASESFPSARTMYEWTFVYYGADAIELGDGSEMPSFTKDGTKLNGTFTITVDRTEDDFPRVTLKLSSATTTVAGSTYILSIPENAWTVSRGEKVYPSKHTLVYKVGAKTTNNQRATLKWKDKSYRGTTYTVTISYKGSTEEQMSAEDAAANFSSVPITLDPSNSSIKAGSGNVTLNEMSGTTIVKTIATYKDPSYSGTTGSYTTTGLTKDSFTPGKTYAFKIEKKAIAVDGYPTGTIGGTYGTQTLSADIIQYFQVLEEGQMPVERELTLLNTSNGVPRVRLDHLEIAAETDDETYGFAIASKNASAMYIGDKDGNILGTEEEEEDVDGNKTGRTVVVPDYSFIQISRKGNVITYTINPSITTEGEYTLVIPAGSFSIDGVDSNKEFRRKFSIRANKPDWSIELYDAVESSSSNGVVGCEDHPMRGFSEIVLTYPEGISVNAGEGVAATPKLYTVKIAESGTNKNKEELATEVSPTTTSISVVAEGNVGTIVFDPPLTDEDTYKLVVPKESFLLLGALGEYVPVDGYTTYFTIKDVTGCEVTPASGSIVLGLPEVRLNFNKAAIAKLEPNPKTRVSVFDENGNEMQEYNLTAVMEGNTGVVTIDPPITKAGRYRVAVPAGRFLCQASSSDTPESSLPYDLWYTVADPSICTVIPASESIVSSVNTFTLDFTEAVRTEVTDTPAFKILNSAGTELSDYSASVEKVDDQEYTVTVTPALTVSGTYKIVVPANSFACKRTPDGDARNNEEMTIVYRVKNPTDCVVTPATNGTDLDDVKEITFKFANAAEVTVDDSKSVSVTDGEGNALAENITGSISVEGNVAKVTFEPAIHAAGTYKVVIPDGLFLCQASATDTPDEVKGCQLTYSIKDRSRMVAVAIEEGRVILELSEITLTYPDAENVALNDAVAEEISLSHAATEGGNVTTTNVTAVKGAEANVLIVTLDPAIAVAGTATLNIPTGKVVADGQYLPAATAVFDVKGNEYQPVINITLQDSYVYEGHETGSDAADTRTFNLYLIGDQEEILDMSEVDPNKVGKYVQATLEPLFTPLSEDELKSYDKDNDDMIYEDPEIEILGTRQLNITVKQAGLYKLTLTYGDQTFETEITIVPNFDNPYFHGIDLKQIDGTENYKMTVPYDESNQNGHVHWIATGHPTYGNEGDNGIWYKLDYPVEVNTPQFASAPAEDSDEWIQLDDKGFDIKNAAGQEPTAIHLKVRSNGVTNTKSFAIGSIVTGVNGVNAEEDVIYVDMQGNRYRNPEKGIYVRISRGHAEKVVIR